MLTRGLPIEHAEKTRTPSWLVPQRDFGKPLYAEPLLRSAAHWSETQETRAVPAKIVAGPRQSVTNGVKNHDRKEEMVHET